MDFGAFEHVALCPWRDFHHGEGVAAVQSRARFWVGVGTNRHPHNATGIECLHDPATQLAEVIIDYYDGNIAQNLVHIGLGIVDAIDQGSDYQKHEGSGVT
jgi:hypothetical protein